MKKILITLILLSLLWVHISYASQKKITREEAFIFLAAWVGKNIPESYKYITLHHSWVTTWSDLETSLQKLVYLNLIQNTPTSIWAQKIISSTEFIALSNRVLWLDLSQESFQTTTISAEDLKDVRDLYITEIETPKTSIKINSSFNTWDAPLTTKEKIFFDVYNTLEKSHYDTDTFSKDDLLDAAISWLTNSTEDKYTTYFPPTDSKNFFTILDGEYEGIGAYVEMPSPWELIIVSPISGSPAESAGLKGWDRVTHVDDMEVTETNSLAEVITWIKGPSGTIVTLTIQRSWESSPLIFEMKRWKIILKDVEYKKLDSKTAYIQIKTFWEHVADDFEMSLEQIAEDKNIQKIIFDLRNNPGWYLDQVANMMGGLVPEGKATAIVSHGDTDTPFISSGKNTIDLSKYEVIFLQNSGTASASEIMIGTLKDYFPESVIIWEQSFWKGSVQTLKNYKDGSTLKYTTAKWYTGRTRTGIDGVWITPDTTVIFDQEKYDNSQIDNQLQKALQQ